MRVRVKGTYKDSYTWDVVSFDKTINIDSCKSAKSWVSQTYGRVHVTFCEEEAPNDTED